MNNNLFKIGFISMFLILFSPSVLAQFRPDRPTFFEDGQRFMEAERL